MSDEYEAAKKRASDRHPSNRMTPERAARLLRAKAGELEGLVHDYVSNPHHLGGLPPPQDMALAADIALIATLLADHMERCDLTRHYHTKTGKVLTDEDIQALADEAERGYDVSHLKDKRDRRDDE
jgi:hypothetical protein